MHQAREHDAVILGTEFVVFTVIGGRGGASGASMVGAVFCGPSSPTPRNAEAYSPWSVLLDCVVLVVPREPFFCGCGGGQQSTATVCYNPQQVDSTAHDVLENRLPTVV